MDIKTFCGNNVITAEEYYYRFTALCANFAFKNCQGCPIRHKDVYLGHGLPTNRNIKIVEKWWQEHFEEVKE